MGRMSSENKLTDEQVKRDLIADAENPDAWEAPIAVQPSTSGRPEWYGRRVLTVGKPREWEAFEKRHRLFFERYADLRDAQNLAFIRPIKNPSRRDLVVFYAGRLAVEDFQEILLLAGNGSGVGALKILRGMYERTVHGRYLSQAPDSEVENFYDWHWVQKHKLTDELAKTMGPDFFT